MSRVVRIVVAFGVSISGIVAVAHHYGAVRANEAASRLFLRRRSLIDSPFVRPPGARRFVAWMGDSTLMAKDPRNSFMERVMVSLRPEGVRGNGRVFMGLDYYHYYCLLPTVLEADPDVLVLVVNYRVLRRGRRRGRAIDLCSALGPSNLLPAIGLPWSDRGVTFGRLLATQVLRWKTADYWFRFVGGFREVGEAWLEEALPFVAADKERRAREDFANRLSPEGLRELAKNFDQPITEAHPVVRMMAATVGAASRRGVPVIVIALPVPYHVLQEHWSWSAERFAMRTAMLRSVVQANGGTFLDLHLALLAEEFRDRSGHFTPDGAAHLARLVEPPLRAALRLPRKRPPRR